MNLTKYIKKENISLITASKELGFSYEDMRRYAAGEVIPRPERIRKIKEWSGGLITSDDFIENYKKEKTDE